MRTDTELRRQAAEPIGQDLMHDMMHPAHVIVNLFFLPGQWFLARPDFLAEIQIPLLPRRLVNLRIAECHFWAGMMEELLDSRERDVVLDESHGECMSERVRMKVEQLAISFDNMIGFDYPIHLLSEPVAFVWFPVLIGEQPDSVRGAFQKFALLLQQQFIEMLRNGIQALLPHLRLIEADDVVPLILVEAVDLDRACLCEPHPRIVEHKEQQRHRVRQRIQMLENLLQHEIGNPMRAQLICPWPYKRVDRKWSICPEAERDAGFKKIEERIQMLIGTIRSRRHCLEKTFHDIWRNLLDRTITEEADDVFQMLEMRMDGVFGNLCMQELVFDETLHEALVVLGWNIAKRELTHHAVPIDAIIWEMKTTDLPDVAFEQRLLIKICAQLIAASHQKPLSIFSMGHGRILCGKGSNIFLTQHAQGRDSTRMISQQEGQEIRIVDQMVFIHVFPVVIVTEDDSERIPDQLLLNRRMRIASEIEHKARIVF